MEQCSEDLGVTQTEKLIFHAKLNLDSMYQQIVDITLVTAFQHLFQVSKWIKTTLSPVKYFIIRNGLSQKH